MQNKLLIATNNPGKQAEFFALLERLEGVELVLPADVSSYEIPAEWGTSYCQNAEIKARAGFRASNIPTIADDSGLEVDALNGEPGLKSARYLRDGAATDEERREYLLKQLAYHPRPWRARFRCCLTLVDSKGNGRNWSGLCEGEITDDPKGGHGFGYDPIFLLGGLGKTMAELSTAEKNLLSHRAIAVQSAIPDLAEYFGSGD